jgi:hypothetical protein
MSLPERYWDRGSTGPEDHLLFTTEPFATTRFRWCPKVSAGLGVGFAPEWTADLPSRNFELRKVRGIDFKIGLGLDWNTEDPTTTRDDIVDIARSLVRRDGSSRSEGIPTAA